MDIFLGVIIGLFVLTILVVAHEFGHFILARRNGVRVLEFGIGFPPRAVAWQKDKKGKWKKLKKEAWPKPTEKPKSLILSLNWLPIGGFCQMDGETAIDERKGTFGAATFWQKTKILFGGVLMNWLFAILIFTILAWTGMPTFLENQFEISSDLKRDRSTIIISAVEPDSPAEKAGLEPGDYLLRNNSEEIHDATAAIDFMETNAGEEVIYTVLRNNEELSLNTTLNSSDADYLLGVTLSETGGLAHYTWTAPLVGIGTTAQLTGETFKGLGKMVWDLLTGVARQINFDPTTRQAGREAIASAGDSVSGPVGILGVIFPAFVETGPTNLAFLAALISISLACMNVLPIPALDGGRWLLILIYKLRKKPLTKETEEKIVSRAFIVLILLMILVTILDITRLFG